MLLSHREYDTYQKAQKEADITTIRHNTIHFHFNVKTIPRN